MHIPVLAFYMLIGLFRKYYLKNAHACFFVRMFFNRKLIMKIYILISKFGLLFPKKLDLHTNKNTQQYQSNGIYLHLFQPRAVCVNTLFHWNSFVTNQSKTQMTCIVIIIKNPCIKACLIKEIGEKENSLFSIFNNCGCGIGLYLQNIYTGW